MNYLIDEYQLNLRRVCANCSCVYQLVGVWITNRHYFGRPHNYMKGCQSSCLSCWLGITELFNVNDHFESDSEVEINKEELFGLDKNCEHTLEYGEPNSPRANLGGELECWPYEEVYPQIVEGDVLGGLSYFTEKGTNLAVIPIDRVHLDRVAVFPGPAIIYPPGRLSFDPLNVVPFDLETNKHSEHCSIISGIDSEILTCHSLVVIPCEFDWESLLKCSHEGHLDFIRQVSVALDRMFFDFVKYKLCRLNSIDDVPATPGQVSSNHMMSGILLYSSQERKSRVFGGAAFPQRLTRGLGMNLVQLEWEAFPASGEVGNIAKHALTLYSSLLKVSDPTSLFIQSMSLLEFLAYPDEYKPFEKVKKVISRYVARDNQQYQFLLNRFYELTGKKVDSRVLGFRTRVVHLGETMEAILPDPSDRNALFDEIDNYIRTVLDHLVIHSSLSWPEYLNVREAMRDFED